MKQFSKLQHQLLDYLADGKCHSGNALGEQLGISRTAVWKQLNLLARLGLNVTRIPQKGYQLTPPFIAIREDRLRRNLASLKKNFDYHIFAETDSTNRYLKDLPGCDAISICCAEKQSAGRGRFGRPWVSPFGGNICLSIRYQLNCCLSKLSCLSLVVSLAILESLKKNSIHQDISVKWPNDLLWNGKKLCGILTEISSETNGYSNVIIGIGMNVNTDTTYLHLTDKACCSLYEITGKYFDRNRLIADIIVAVDLSLSRYLGNGFHLFHELWKRVDYLQGKLISVSQFSGTLSGTANGITELGQLRLVDEYGFEHHLSSGDASLGGFVPG